LSEVGTIVAGLLTLAVFTFLYRDNPVYKLAEHLLLGISIGYMVVVTWNNTLRDSLFVPLLKENDWWLIIPLVLGLMMFARMFRKTRALVKIPIAVLIGSGAGVAIPAMLSARTMKQMSATVVPLLGQNHMPNITAIIVMLGVLTTLSYFYFSREHKGAVGVSAKTGTYFLMLFFGTTFGYTVMSRMSTFIGRMEFLLTDFLHLTH